MPQGPIVSGAFRDCYNNIEGKHWGELELDSFDVIVFKCGGAEVKVTKEELLGKLGLKW